MFKNNKEIIRSNVFINFIEFKFRIIYFLVGVLSIFFVCFIYKVELFYVISYCFLNIGNSFIYTNVIDPLVIYFKLSFLMTILISFPLFVYIFGFFFFRSFYNFYTLFWFLFIITLYCISYIIYISVFNIFFSNLLEFLLEYQRADNFTVYSLVLQATITQYFSLFLNTLILYLIIIIFPIIFFFLSIFNIINKSFFLNLFFRKYLYIIMFTFYLLVMPPDFLIQLILLPIFICILEIYIYIILYFFYLYNLFV